MLRCKRSDVMRIFWTIGCLNFCVGFYLPGIAPVNYCKKSESEVCKVRTLWQRAIAFEYQLMMCSFIFKHLADFVSVHHCRGIDLLLLIDLCWWSCRIVAHTRATNCLRYDFLICWPFGIFRLILWQANICVVTADSPLLIVILTDTFIMFSHLRDVVMCAAST